MDNISKYSPESGIIQLDTIEMVIEPSGLVSVTERVSIREGDIVSILLPSNIQDLHVLDSKATDVSYESVPRDDSELVSFLVQDSDNDKNGAAVIKYDTQHLTGKNGDLWNFTFITTATPFITVINLKTPNNTRIVQIDFSDFNWAPKGDSELFIYPTVKDFYLKFTYKIGIPGPIIPKPGTTTTTTPFNATTTTTPDGSRNMDVSFFVFISIVFAVLVLFSVLFLRKKGKPVKEEKGADSMNTGLSDQAVRSGSQMLSEPVKVDSEGVKDVFDYVPSGVSGEVEVALGQHSRSVKDSIINVLDENEKKIIKMLEESSEEITQAYIYKSTGIPKSSLSDTIKRLEKRNIIERKKEGRTNWIKLKDWVLS